MGCLDSYACVAGSLACSCIMHMVVDAMHFGFGLITSRVGLLNNPTLSFCGWPMNLPLGMQNSKVFAHLLPNFRPQFWIGTPFEEVQ